MREYVAPPTIAKFLREYRNNRVNLVLGPIGSGKTVGMIMTLMDWAVRQEPNQYGVRKTRFAIVRNTRPMLRDSVLQSVRDWIDFADPRVTWKDTRMTLTIEYGLPDGTKVHCELMFRALDDQDDAAKLLSVEYTGAHLSEFREIPLSLLTDLRSRMGRYPSEADGGPTYHGVIGESNFPVRGSEWYDLIEVAAPKWLTCLKQPSAMSAEAENIDHLPKGYYDELMQDTSPQWQEAHILCIYPDADDGQAVFRRTFNRERHVSAEPLRPILHLAAAPPILVGIDQGRSPAAVFAQLDGRGRLNVYSELYAANIGMRAFCADYIMPHLKENYFNVPVMVIADPAAAHKTEVDDESPLDVLRASGLHAVPAPTNSIDRRLEAVDRLLTAPDGIRIDNRCVELIAALSYKYRFKTKGLNQLAKTVPEKLHPWSDLADALQYIALSAGGVRYGRVVRHFRPRGDTESRRPPTRAWT